jgi:ribosome-binding protein aMBF1 (putative translation factor)
MGRTLEEILEHEMQDEEFASALRNAEPLFEIAHQVMLLRQAQEMTQESLAEKVGTKQSSISRLESMNSSPSVSFLQRIATALNADLRIAFVPREQ